MTWDIGAILSGLAALTASLIAASQARQARRQAQAANNNAALAVAQTNGPLSKQGVEISTQSVTLDLILDGQRSIGHQLGEIRRDMGRMDTRLTGEVSELRTRFNAVTPQPRRRAAANRRATARSRALSPAESDPATPEPPADPASIDTPE